MGKNYEDELALIPESLRWAASFDISPWEPIFARLKGGCLIVVASGGSVSAAHMLAQLHISTTGKLAVVMTPLEFISETHALDATVWFISAGGSNNDIVGALDAAIRLRVRDLVVLCGKKSSALVTLAEENKVKGIIAFDLPAGNDGFLATNSLVVFFGLALKCYSYDLPETIRHQDVIDEVLLGRDTIIVLYAGWLKPIAIDIESRFVEAALGSVQISDFRNFAHGRHHWMAKRSTNTSVLALVSPRYLDLANEILTHIPSDIPVVRWEISEEDPVESIVLLRRSLELAGRAAEKLGYNAGRPGVPEFGHRIYDLRTKLRLGLQTEGEIFIERKLRSTGTLAASERKQLEVNLANFTAALYQAEFAAIVLDYDGTMVETSHRFDSIPAEIASELNRLLSEGMTIGIATGRGKSIHPKLREAIDPQYWDKVCLGYYNGAVIRSLAEGCEKLASDTVVGDLKKARECLQSLVVTYQAEIETRTDQVTVQCKALDEKSLWLRVLEGLENAGITALKVARSSHSVDVLPRSVSKRNVVTHIASHLGVQEERVLKIGDRGSWPGNDVELLAMSNGLSVDQVSGSLTSCWNLAPHQVTGTEATLHYLSSVRSSRYFMSRES